MKEGNVWRKNESREGRKEVIYWERGKWSDTWIIEWMNEWMNEWRWFVIEALQDFFPNCNYITMTPLQDSQHYLTHNVVILCYTTLCTAQGRVQSVLTTLTAIHKYGVRYQNTALRMSVEAALTVKANITATAPSMASRGFGSTVITIC